MNTKYIKYAIIIFSFMMVSCSPKLSNNSSVSKEKVFYPFGLDTAKIQYLTSITSSDDIVKKKSAFQQSIVGNEEVKIIAKPYGVSIKKGKIYISDVALRAIVIVDLNNNKFDYFRPTGLKSFGLPINTFIDDDENIYIVDTRNHCIQVYDNKLNHTSTFGVENLENPTDIYIENELIYVVDTKLKRVQIFDKTSEMLIDYFPKSVVAGNVDYLYAPTNLSISNELIYITDMGETNVKIYDKKGQFVRKVGGLGQNLGQFVRPKGNAVDKEGVLYVVDSAFEQIQMFNSKGELLMFFGGSHNEGIGGGLWLPTQITLEYENFEYFKKYVDPKYELKYLILVANQFGPNKINIYGRVELKK